MTNKPRPKQQNKPKPKKPPKKTVQIRTGDFSDIRGEVNIAAGDIIKNIQTIHERDLTPGEILEKDLQIEVNELSRGIRDYLDRLRQQATFSGAPSPYKGLDAYTLSDADIFFGRDQAISDLRQAIKRGKLTILQAESGAGKTSLLQAGIVPRLIVEKQLAIIIRPQFENPAYAIKRCFLGNLELTPKLARTPLVDFLRRVKGIIGGATTLYLILDQFEEFFTKHTLEEDRQAFIGDLAQCLNDATLNVRWIISITTDAFGQLGKFEPRIQNPFSNVQSLYLFNRQEAAEVIARPADQHNLLIQEGLLERLLDDLSQSQNELIAPTQIQLVCVALYDDFRDQDRVFTLAHYEQRGGAQGILRGYIANVLSRYLPQEERGPAYKILEELVTSEKKRILRAKSDLEKALEGRGISHDLIESALNHLVNRRLLRQLGDDTEHIQYEIVHDYLLNEIDLDDELRDEKEAAELLDQGKRNWRKFGVVLNKDTLAIIGKKRNELHFTPEDISLVLLSLADAKRNTREWHHYVLLARKNNYGDELSKTLVPLIVHSSKKLRNNAYKVLWSFLRNCPVNIQPKIVLWNIALRTPMFLRQAILATFLALILYGLALIYSRDRLEKIGWQTVNSLQPDCLSTTPVDDLSISADPSNPSNIVVFGKSQPYICQSTDAGDSWVSLSSGLPQNIKINSIALYKQLRLMISTEQILYWNEADNTWRPISFPSQSETEFNGVSIGGEDHQFFIGSSPHQIISLQTNRKCWEIIEKDQALSEDEKGKCWDQIDTDSISGQISFLSTNEKYIVAGTSDGTWYSQIEEMEWKKQSGLEGPILSFALHKQSFLDDGVFIVVLTDRGVQRGKLGLPELSISNEWPFPGVNGDDIWDWPPNTTAIAASKYVFFASTPGSLQRYPGWNIFDREWWQIMKEDRSIHRMNAK